MTEIPSLRSDERPSSEVRQSTHQVNEVNGKRFKFCVCVGGVKSSAAAALGVKAMFRGIAYLQIS